MAQLKPYLNFHGQCKDAMNFYKEVFGGELTIMLAGASPVADQMPPQYHSGVLHSTLKTADFEIMATDMTPFSPVDGNTIYQCLICKTEKEARQLFDKLSAGGRVVQPLHEMFFGLIGTLEDKFGIYWMVECDKK